MYLKEPDIRPERIRCIIMDIYNKEAFVISNAYAICTGNKNGRR